MDSAYELTAEQTQFEGLIQWLIDHNYGSCDDFFSPDVILYLRNHIGMLYESGAMEAAGIGNKTAAHTNQLIRGDKIKWLADESEDAFEVIFRTKIKNFIAYLNTTCYTSIGKSEFHYACYGQNSFYKRHLDQFMNDNGRKFSIIVYLNKDWLPEDRGVLSLYPKNSPQIDIAPLGGRMVFFRSDEMEHEVHPSFTRERISIAGWLKN